MFDNEDLTGFGKTEDKTSIISESCTIVGDIITDDSLIIKGVVQGNITSTNKINMYNSVTGDISGKSIVLAEATLNGNILKANHLDLLYPESTINGSVTADNCDCKGSIKGNIYLSNALSLASTAKVVGDVKVGSLAVEKGANLRGKVNIEQGK